MITAAIEFVERALLPLGAPGLLVAAFLEEVIAPIPSAVVMVSAGFFFLEGPFTLSLIATLLFTIVIPIALGVTLGSIVIYTIFYYGGKPFIEKWGRWFGLRWSDIERAQAKIDASYRDELILFGLRVVPVVPNVAIGALCGIVRYSFKKYVIATLCGSAVRAAILALLGWEVGELYLEYTKQIEQYEHMFALVALVLVLLFVGWKIYKRNV